MGHFILMDDDCNIEISENDYNNALIAKDNLLKVLEIEEKYNMILENYKEIEQEIFESTLDLVLHRTSLWRTLRIKTRNLDRKLNNLLSIIKLFLDHIPDDLNKVYGRELEKEVKKLIIKEGKEKFACHFMYELRNYIQHNGLSIDDLRFGSERKEIRKKERNIKEIYLSINKKKILDYASDDLKKKIIDKTSGDRIELKPLIRENIESLSLINNFIRNKTKDKIKNWDMDLKKIKDKYFNKTHKNINYNVLLTLENKECTDEKNIFYDFIEYRKDLIKRNKELKNLKNNLTGS